MPYVPDDIIYHIHLWKSVKDTLDAETDAYKIMGETSAEYDKLNAGLQTLTGDWQNATDETRRDLTARLLEAIAELARIGKIYETDIAVAQTATQQYLAAKALVA